MHAGRAFLLPERSGLPRRNGIELRTECVPDELIISQTAAPKLARFGVLRNRFGITSVQLVWPISFATSAFTDIRPTDGPADQNYGEATPSIVVRVSSSFHSLFGIVF